MPSGSGIAVTGAVEGDLDEAVLRQVVTYAGCWLGNVHGRQGKPKLLQRLAGFNNAAQFSPWVVLIDLDQDCNCAPECLQRWLPQPASHMHVRVVVRAVEAWLLADRERFANFLGIAQSNLPENSDSLGNPKLELVNLARPSNRRIKYDLVPRDGSGRSVGPLYTARMLEFVNDENTGWRVDQATHNSDSLARCVQKLIQIKS